MKKVAIIGAITHEQKTLIEALVKGVEERTGEKVVAVNVHEKDADFLTQKVTMDEVESYLLKSVKMYSPPPEPKRKGHIRPYKHHR